MKIKKIRIKSQDQLDGEIFDAVRKAEKGDKFKPVRGEFFESLDAVRNVLTPKRLQLWKAVRDRKPESILDLAKMVKRDFRAVHGDLRFLEAVGLIAFEETKGLRGNRQKPKSLADEIELRVA